MAVLSDDKDVKAVMCKEGPCRKKGLMRQATS